MIRIGFYGHDDDMAAWRRTLATRLPAFEISRLLEPAGQECDVALVWAPPPGALSDCPNLRGIIMQGQGVDHMMHDTTVPRDLPLVRLVDPDMASALSQWALLCALDFWRDGDHYRTAQAEKRWDPRPQRPAAGGRVGILGVGAIGSVIASRFAALGFAVRGYARSPKSIDGIEMFVGADQLNAFAEDLQIVVSVLPLTPDTTGIINAGFLNRVTPGAFVINGGRGPQIIDDDLLAALDSGHVGGAALDVFATEPLPQTHRYWTHPNVRVWPHVAAQTNAETAADQVAAAIDSIMAGRRPKNQVDWARGY